MMHKIAGGQSDWTELAPCGRSVEATLDQCGERIREKVADVLRAAEAGRSKLASWPSAKHYVSA